MSDKRSATVWSWAFVPSKSPFQEYGQQGYSVAWVDTAEGRVQVLVAGDPPDWGAAGTIVATELDAVTVDAFVAEPL